MPHRGGSKGRDGLSFLLVPSSSRGTLHTIRQMTGDIEFNELSSTARTRRPKNIVGAPVKAEDRMACPISSVAVTLAQQMSFRGELERLCALARAMVPARTR